MCEPSLRTSWEPFKAHLMAMERLTEYRKRFLDDLLSKWKSLGEGVSASPMNVENLPETLRGWFYQEGSYLLRIFPKESVWQEHALGRVCSRTAER